MKTVKFDRDAEKKAIEDQWKAAEKLKADTDAANLKFESAIIAKAAEILKASKARDAEWDAEEPERRKKDEIDEKRKNLVMTILEPFYLTALKNLEVYLASLKPKLDALKPQVEEARSLWDSASFLAYESEDFKHVNSSFKFVKEQEAKKKYFEISEHYNRIQCSTRLRGVVKGDFAYIQEKMCDLEKIREDIWKIKDTDMPAMLQSLLKDEEKYAQLLLNAIENAQDRFWPRTEVRTYSWRKVMDKQLLTECEEGRNTFVKPMFEMVASPSQILTDWASESPQ